MYLIFSANDILSIEIISINETGPNTNDNNQSQNKVTVKRPIAKRAGRSISESVSSSTQSTSSQTQSNFKKPDSNAHCSMEQPTNGKLLLGTTQCCFLLHYRNIKCS